jgi:hypothetical protein
VWLHLTVSEPLGRVAWQQLTRTSQLSPEFLAPCIGSAGVSLHRRAPQHRQSHAAAAEKMNIIVDDTINKPKRSTKMLNSEAML